MHYYGSEVTEQLKKIREKYPYKFVKMVFCMGKKFERFHIHKIMHVFHDDKELEMGLLEGIKVDIEMDTN